MNLSKVREKLLMYLSKNYPYRVYKTISTFYNMKKELDVRLSGDIYQEANLNKKRILINLIELQHPQFFNVLFLAEALRQRGADIKVLVCDSTLQGCEVKSVRSGLDPCFTCRFNLKNITPKFNVKFIKISEYITNSDLENIRMDAKRILDNKKLITKESVDITTIVNDSVVRYFYGGQDTYTAKKVKSIKLDHIVSSMIGIHVANKIYLKWRPDSILSHMGSYSAFAPYSMVSGKYSIKNNFISQSNFDKHKIILNAHELHKGDSRFRKWSNYRNNSPLTDLESRELDGFISARFSGKSNSFRENNYFTDKGFLDQIFIDPKKTNIFLFPSIYWDIGISNSVEGIYSDVIEWVLDTVEALKDNKNICLYIKPHPGESITTDPSNKGVIDFIIEKFGDIPKNMTIINADMKIMPYDLFPYIDIGLVFWGTLGLEMLLKNIPTICVGGSPYSFLESTSYPSSKKEYLKQLLGSKDLAKPDSNEVRLFAYFYFIKTLIPWTMTSQYMGGVSNISFSNLKQIQSGENKYLDHLCDCILEPDQKVIENW